MPRDLRYRDVWENCYYSTFGRERALRYAEIIYCNCGVRRYLCNNEKVDEVTCYDWHKCKGLDQVVTKKKTK